MKGRTMTKIMMIFLSVMILVSMGCIKKERDPLGKYSDIFTLADLRRVISYPGIIEKQVAIKPQAVHIKFYIQANTRKGDEIFIANIEYLISSERELIKYMKTSEPITGIGDRAWYDSFEKGSAGLIFYVADKNILVGLEGRTKGSDYPPSTFINKEEFIIIAKLIEKRLK